jgi:C4-type Zn-finger protein
VLELLPCPFCGGKAEIIEKDVEPQGDPYYGKKLEKFPRCEKCWACLFDGYFHEGFYKDEDAAKAWNTRC